MRWGKQWNRVYDHRWEGCLEGEREAAGRSGKVRMRPGLGRAVLTQEGDPCSGVMRVLLHCHGKKCSGDHHLLAAERQWGFPLGPGTAKRAGTEETLKVDRGV